MFLLQTSTMSQLEIKTDVFLMVGTWKKQKHEQEVSLLRMHHTVNNYLQLVSRALRPI